LRSRICGRSNLDLIIILILRHYEERSDATISNSSRLAQKADSNRKNCHCEPYFLSCLCKQKSIQWPTIWIPHPVRNDINISCSNSLEKQDENYTKYWLLFNKKKRRAVSDVCSRLLGHQIKLDALWSNRTG